MGECETCGGPITSDKFDSDECRDNAEDYHIELTCVANSRHKFKYRIFPEMEVQKIDSDMEAK